jgi:hypothetical protein
MYIQATCMGAATLTIPAQVPRPLGYLQRLWRLVATSILASAAVLFLSVLLPRTVTRDPTYDDQAETIVGPLWSAMRFLWPVVAGAIVCALLVRVWLPDPRDGARLKLAPLAAVLAAAIALGSFGGSPGAVVGVGLGPLLLVAYLLPRLPREQPRRRRPALAALLVLALVVPPVADGLLLPVEGAGVGCGSVPCRVAGGTTDLGIGLHNRGRLPVVVTGLRPDDLAGGVRPVELRDSRADGTRGSRVNLPVVLDPGGQLFVDSTVRVPRGACPAPALAGGGEIRYRVLGIPRTVRVEPTGIWRRGLGCQATG